MLVIGFIIASGMLWVSVCGYLAILLAIAAHRRRQETVPSPAPLPAIAVVIPVRDEEAFIAAKLADLQRSTYPRDLVTTLVVDGGSRDRTAALVEAAATAGAPVELVRVAGARGKPDQLNAVLARLPHDIIVVSDADTALDPDCIPHLVNLLRADPATGVVGARIRPATRLLEERLHWWLVNALWWAEGEALGSAAISGVCYALRREAITALPADCLAEDIYTALVATARGWRVRLCRQAVATELRVPQTASEFLRFRRRRGLGYLRELLRVLPVEGPRRWQAVRWLRLAHFFITPIVTVVTAATAAVLCASGHWQWPLIALAAFAVPAAVALALSTTLADVGRRRWRLGLAAGRLAGLTWLALLAAPLPLRQPSPGD